MVLRDTKMDMATESTLKRLLTPTMRKIMIMEKG